MEMNNMYGTMNNGYGMGYDPNAMYYNNNPAMGYVQNIPTPTNQSTLTPEEVQSIKAAPTNKITISVDHNDVTRSMCNHKNNGYDLVQRVNDGSGDVYCPQCGERWNPDLMSKEEMIELVNRLIDQMQTAKWVGDLPTELVRDYFSMIPLLRKYPDIHEFAMNTFNKYYNAHGMMNAQDANVYSMYNSLMGGVNPYQQPMGGYMNQPQPMAYYNQAQQPQMNNGYMPGMVGQTQQANPMVNPMQAPYGVNPAAPNQQFVNQANMMMQGSVYGQAQQPQMNNGYMPGMVGQAQQQVQNPVFGATAQQQVQTQPGPTVSGAAQTTDAQATTGPTITGQADGTVKSESKITL